MCEHGVYDISDQSVQGFVWANLKRLYSEEKIFDISLVATDGEVSAHKVILASVSSYFKVLMTSELSSGNGNLTTIKLPFCSVSTLKSLLNFIYTGKMSLCENNIMNMLEVQDFLGIGILRNHITFFLISTLNDNNCWLYHEIAERHCYREVFAKVDRYIRSNFTKLITGKKEEFLNVPPKQLLSFFNSDFLEVINYEDLLVSLCEWLNHGGAERMALLEEVLSHVDTTQIASWRGIEEKLSALFSEEFQPMIVDWAKKIGECREGLVLESKPPLKRRLLEVVFLIGGIISGEVVPSTDVFVPPVILFRVLPKSVDSKQLVIIPPMHYKRVRPTAVSSCSSIYVIGGTQNHEELKAEGIPCEVYKLSDNKWHLLPNLPQNKDIKVSTNRRPPAAFVGGHLYAALPSPRPSFWVLSKNETCWVGLPAPDAYEIFDLVGINGALYSISRRHENSMCYVLDRYDIPSELWYRVSVFSLSSSIPQVKGLSLDSYLIVTSGEQWLRFDPQRSDWKRCKLAVSCGEVLPSLCTYKERQIVSLRHQEEGVSIPSLEVVSPTGASEFFVPGRSSAALANLLVPVTKPEPI